MNAELQALRANLSSAIRGKSDALDLFLTAILAGGHILIEDVPGTGKTTLAKAFARSVAAVFSRIQFTPDLLPTDILGGMVYRASDGSFAFRPGPVFANIVLADEINRASPRTQSALLEAMAERQVSIEGETRRLPEQFFVIATQNPVEYNGTYPLPEAQLDRFTMRLSLGYASPAEEAQILRDHSEAIPVDSLKSVTSLAQLAEMQGEVRRVKVEDSLLGYIVSLIGRTRADPRARLGASPRGSLDLRRCAQARAWLAGRAYALPDDIKALAVPALAHRILLDVKAAHSGATGAAIVEDAVNAVRIPA